MSSCKPASFAVSINEEQPCSSGAAIQAQDYDYCQLQRYTRVLTQKQTSITDEMT